MKAGFANRFFAYRAVSGFKDMTKIAFELLYSPDMQEPTHVCCEQEQASQQWFWDNPRMFGKKYQEIIEHRCNRSFGYSNGFENVATLTIQRDRHNVLRKV